MSLYPQMDRELRTIADAGGEMSWLETEAGPLSEDVFLDALEAGFIAMGGGGAAGVWEKVELTPEGWDALGLKPPEAFASRLLRRLFG